MGVRELRRVIGEQLDTENQQGDWEVYTDIPAEFLDCAVFYVPANTV